MSEQEKEEARKRTQMITAFTVGLLGAFAFFVQSYMANHDTSRNNNRLNRQLQIAVNKEDYERAAVLRDIINDKKVLNHESNNL
mgnify:CR=1 FL=1